MAPAPALKPRQALLRRPITPACGSAPRLRLHTTRRLLPGSVKMRRDYAGVQRPDFSHASGCAGPTFDSLVPTGTPLSLFLLLVEYSRFDSRCDRTTYTEVATFRFACNIAGKRPGGAHNNIHHIGGCKYTVKPCPVHASGPIHRRRYQSDVCRGVGVLILVKRHRCAPNKSTVDLVNSICFLMPRMARSLS